MSSTDFIDTQFDTVADLKRRLARLVRTQRDEIHLSEIEAVSVNEGDDWIVGPNIAELLQAHAIKLKSGRIWDEYNGWRDAR